MYLLLSVSLLFLSVRHVGMLTIKGTDFRVDQIPLKTVRPFMWDTVSLSKTGIDPLDTSRIQSYLEQKVTTCTHTHTHTHTHIHIHIHTHKYTHTHTHTHYPCSISTCRVQSKHITINLVPRTSGNKLIVHSDIL